MPYFGTNVKEWQSGLGVDFLVLTRFENPVVRSLVYIGEIKYTMQWESLAAWIEARGHGQGDGYPGENMLAYNVLMASSPVRLL